MYLEGRCQRSHQVPERWYDDSDHQGSEGVAATTQQPMTSKQASKEEIMPPLRIIHAKLDRLLFETGHESEKHQEESETDGLLIE